MTRWGPGESLPDHPAEDGWAKKTRIVEDLHRQTSVEEDVPPTRELVDRDHASSLAAFPQLFDDLDRRLVFMVIRVHVWISCPSMSGEMQALEGMQVTRMSEMRSVRHPQRFLSGRRTSHRHHQRTGMSHVPGQR